MSLHIAKCHVDPKILCHPNIPKPLHGVNPRTIFGQEWWDKNRQITYAENNYHCFACGTHKQDALFHKWLEAHEFYLYDYENGRITFDHLVALCHACHNYIHDGRMRMLVNTEQMEISKYNTIVEHGDLLIEQSDLKHERSVRHHHASSVAWEDWRMIISGKEYGPSTQSFHQWKQGLWKGWSP